MHGTDPFEAELEAALDRIHGGARPADCETETLDFKEDRGHATQRPSATRAYADELAAHVACLANSAGGILVVGVQDRMPGAAAFTGSDLDVQLLRRRVWELTEPSLTCEVRERTEPTTGARLLVARVTAATGVHTVKGRYRHRVGAQCVDMDPQAIVERMGRLHDWSAERSSAGLGDIDGEALTVARRLLRDSGEQSRIALAEARDRELLRRLGVLDTERDGLNRAGSVLLCSHDGELRLLYRRRNQPGGDTVQRVEDAGQPLLVELDRVLSRIEVNNVHTGPTRGAVRGLRERIPAAAAREAIVNAIMHRDWSQAYPIEVSHVVDRLEVVSPGGFPPGVRTTNLLTTPSRPRNPALAEAMRTLRLAEREAVGIDRMFREMILIGHEPPVFSVDEQGVRCVLLGGEPVEPVLALTGRLSRSARQDVDLAIVLNQLFDHAQVSPETLAVPLQRPVEEARAALRSATAQRLEDDEAPVVVEARTSLPEGCRLGDRARRLLAERLPYFGVAAPSEAEPTVLETARLQGTVRNSDLTELTGLSQTQVSQLLTRMRDSGTIEVGSTSDRGRSVFYVLPGASVRHRSDGPQ